MSEAAMVVSKIQADLSDKRQPGVDEYFAHFESLNRGNLWERRHSLTIIRMFSGLSSP